MTFVNSKKAAKEDIDKKAIIGENEKQPPFWLREHYIQACAWILLTIGLCIIVVTFYLALYQNNSNDMSRNYKVDDNVVTDGGNGVLMSQNTPNYNDSIAEDEAKDFHIDGWLDSPQNSRLIMNNIFGGIAVNLIGCQEKLCKIGCSHDNNVFMSLFDTMQTTTCPSIDVLLLDSQYFPNNTLQNSWMPMNLSVHELIIRSGHLSIIKSRAFNSPIFGNIFLMSLLNLKIETLEYGALVGLKKLKYLTIDSHVKSLEPALFKPVQNTLTHLKLHTKLDIVGDRNLFGVSYMPKLEYLDLSYNNISGTLERWMFSSTPNLKYLIMISCQLQRIESNTFNHLADKLIFLNLSKNKLITLAAEVIEPLLRNNVGAMMSLSHNKWLCDCAMQNLSLVYRKYRNQFIDAVYCVAPHNVYGVSIDEVDYEKLEDCELLTTAVTEQESLEENEDPLITTTTTSVSTTKGYANTPPLDWDAGDGLDSDDIKSEEPSSVFKMRCISVDSSDDSSSSLSSASRSSETLERNVDLNGDMDYFKLPPPSHEFDLQLLAENNSVIVVVDSPENVVVIWFSEQQEADFISCNNRSVDYECMRYAKPQMMVGPLVENTTYTFCLLPSFQDSISPFNCLPLHVPIKRKDNIWISQDYKQFTIGMLCLIFLVSTIMGALVAYFGIKTYPDLLEGSKNVVVVKKPEASCYVATISEMEYSKQNSLKKRKSSAKDDCKKELVKKEALKKQTSAKLPLPPVPFNNPPLETPPPSFQMSIKNLERMSSAFGFDGPFLEDDLCKEENYETPRSCENEYSLDQRSVPNNYGMSPGSPPPLPKRNSNISDSPTVVMNRFSTHT
uniref:LRRCT domain-containing protein n=1 Tax=Stomoxys calcitrans TaxID=35570 RepID=A0A1I8PD96_STOCA